MEAKDALRSSLKNCASRAILEGFGWRAIPATSQSEGRAASDRRVGPRRRYDRNAAGSIPTTPAALLYALASQSPAQFFYVYLLVSHDREHRYTGITRDLAKRLKKHNAGVVPHTSKHRPWSIETAIAFRSQAKATEYERYLKSHAGREYAKRHV